MKSCRPLLAAFAVPLVGAALTACGISVPADPNGTLDRVTGGALNVGIAHNPPRTDVSGASPAGVEVGLVQEFADDIGATINWTVDSEAGLVEGLDAGTLDIAIAGFHDDTPWSSEAGMTRACMIGFDDRGEEVSYVMLIPMGENAFLVELEDHLCGNG